MRSKIHLILAVTAALTCAGFTETGQQRSDNRGGLLDEFYAMLQTGDLSRSERLFNYFDSLINSNGIASSIELSDARYLCGLHLYFGSRYLKARDYFEESAKIRASLGQKDPRYRNALTNIGTSLYQMGRFGEAIVVLDSLIILIELQDGNKAEDNIASFSNLAANLNELREFDKAIIAAQKGLEIAEYHGIKSDISSVVMLLNNLAISHSRRNDYTRASIYLTRAYDLLKECPVRDISLYLNLVNSLTVNHTRLGNRDIAMSYFEEAVPVALRSKGESSFLLISNYARFLAENGDLQKASRVLEQGIDLIASGIGTGSRVYYDMIVRAASTLSQFGIDNTRALELLIEQAIPYSKANNEDRLLIRDIYNSYAMALLRNGSLEEALEAVQSALFGIGDIGSRPILDNPDRDMFSADRVGLGLLNDKIKILRLLYEDKADISYLIAAVETNRLLISYLETVRIDITEEESRILLGDNYRKVYDGIINDLYLLWSTEGRDAYLSLAFEYAERGKAAGLLVSMREVRASQFLIPDSLSVLERNLDVELGAVREYIAIEMSRENPDPQRLAELRNSEFSAAERKSDLTRLFERNYPEYYAAKYNTAVACLDEVKKMLGRQTSYINYVFADTVMYIFLVNRRHSAFIRQTLDADFFQVVNDFRQLLMKPPAASQARVAFNGLIEKGYYLHEKLIRPVREMLYTRRLIISPDNILAYIPFETLLSSGETREDLLYRELGFLVKEFEISYTYSATTYIETSGTRRSFTNKVLAFAPFYSQSVERDSVLNSRQARQEVLSDLPYAREEASYVFGKLGGELYLNNRALESTFKERAPGFPVIHLAMHAIINDHSPGYSRLIFSRESGEEGFLNTYEIYGIPLSARLVVVSSCNTGSGKLRSGEGVMSMARGFINAGSHSVVMSLWEVDDRLGSETVKLFYDNLRGGDRKSSALRKAKLNVLNDSHQFQSHPYYWSTLVLYGNSGALFVDSKMFISAILLGLAIATALIRFFYLRSK